MKHLAAYPTSWDADNKRLKTEKNLSFNEQNILKMIMAEKKILMLLIKAMDRFTELLGFEIKVFNIFADF